jgi:hypothetical protein
MINKNSLLNNSDIRTFEEFILKEELFTWEKLCRYFSISKTKLKSLLLSKEWSLNEFRKKNHNIILEKTKKERILVVNEKKEKAFSIAAKNKIIKKPKITMKDVKNKSLMLEFNPSLRLSFFKTETAIFIIKFMIYKRFLSMSSIAKYCGFSREYIRKIFLKRNFKFKDFKVKVKKSLIKN